MEDQNLSGVSEIDDLEDVTEIYPADSELVEDAEALAGDDADDSFLDEDGDGIPDDEESN